MDAKVLDKLVAKHSDFMRYETEKKITWCSNCGNYGIQNALRRALVLEDIDWRNVVLCFDVGCNGNGSDKIETYTIHGLHGRVLPLAAGVKIANHKLNVVASAGDGATFSEGVNHLVHAVRNNYPILFLHHNNENYGLTTGQASALSRCGTKRNAAPQGVVVPPLNPLDFVLSLNPSFVARAFTGEVDHLTEMIRAGLKHDGFAFIDILQACPTYNRETTDQWYSQRIKFIEEKSDYDRHDIWQARRIVQDLDQEIYLGLLYENKERVSFLDMQATRKFTDSTLVDEVQPGLVSELL
jgi:2-oxoglutarate ferredoxin oxidoreductase subunit beta